MDKVNISLIGVGRMGQFHLNVISQINHINLSGIYDADENHLNEISQKYNIKKFNSIDEAIDNADAVIIASPTTFHFEIAKKAVEKGKHVLVEKPMTETYAQALELEEIVKQAVKDANRNVCEQTSPFVETGTTLSVVVILGDYAVLANVGDSPVYYYRSKTKEFQLISSLQTRAEQDVARGKYERYSEEYYENDHIIYSSLGAREELQNEDIFVNVIGYINSGDMFLVGSDGSFGRMKENEIYQIISGEEEYTVLKELFEEARKDKDDDQTAVFYKVCGEEW